MRRFAAAAVLASLFAMGCNTYQQDLKRAEAHYTENRYESALALFRVLEDDLDSLSPADQAKYAYLRGMTDFRLAKIAVTGSGAADPRKMFRINARHWLGVAAATEKASPGGLTMEEKQRMDETLADLNAEVYGGAEAVPDAPPATSGAPSADPAAPGATPAPAGPGAQPAPGATPAAPGPAGQPAMGTMPGGQPK
ncbi:MAG: hypothetical protein R3B70_28695 [Polyangiaceae bacterium]